MLNKNRKGVSEVVANVLIVLLVIVGIAVIWSVVKPTIDKSSNAVRSDCFTVQVEPVSCNRFGTCAVTTAGGTATCASGSVTESTCEATAGCTWTAATIDEYTIAVKRNPGAGSFEDIEAVFSDRTNTERESLGIASTDINELESKTKGIASTSLTSATPPTEVNIVLKANGQLCQVTTQAVECN